ncbi:MAG: hypothetical protein WBF18_14390 [Solirubrobacterales bacterium]
MRGSTKLLLALIAIWAFALTATSAQAAKPQVKLLSKGQSGILANGSVKARVTLKVRKGRRAKVKVRGLSSTFDRPKYRALTKSRRLIFKRSSSKKVRLPLSSSGKSAVESCRGRTLRVKAGASKASRELVRQSAACKPRPLDLSRASQCNFIGSAGDSLCMLPFPDDFHTVPDPATETGRRINFQSAAMPANSASVHIAAAPYNANDGFSPGQGIVVRVPGLDNPAALAKTAPVPINDLGRYTGKRTPVVVIDANTGERWPIWVEIDSNASGPGETALEIHPARNFDAKHRYIVAMRNLKDSEGNVIPAPEGFRYYRDDLPSKKRPINKWRGRFDSIFSTLRTAGIRRANLYVAWDFTVASDQNIARRALHIRDDAFSQLGDTELADGVVAGAAPSFSVDTVNTDPKPGVARRVRGSFEVPCYLFPSCAPGGRFKLDAGGLPTRNGDWTANFDCTIPHSAVDDVGAYPGRPAVYGHGLFGSASEVYNADIQNEFAQDYNFVLCATDEIGMSGNDVANTGLHILPDLSNFPELADRLQQGLLNELYLGRLMDTTAAQGGFLSDVNFHADGATLGSARVIDPSELYYDGSSQGGIMGGALTALSPDFTRAALNVPAMNYSVLLPRSVDYEPFAQILEANYSDDLSHPLILSLIQMLWDRGEPNGYAHRMTTEPLPDTPAHEVLMSIALGDHQVTNFQADVEARTIGAQTHTPVLYPGRWPGVDVLWDVPAISSYPYEGSAAIYFDIGPERANPSPPPPMIGVSPPPLTNVPNEAGEDPHGAPRGAPTGLHLISDFLAPNGAVTNVCGSDACYSGGFSGP